MRSSRIPDATDLAILKANGALDFDTDNGVLCGVFDAEGVRVGFGDANFSSDAPQITCRESDAVRLEVNQSGARISYKDKNFTVREVQPDGTGMMTLVLDADE